MGFANCEAALAATSVSGEILTDTVWTKAQSPYVVENYLEVSEGATLVIEPGVVVKFNQSYIDVYGKIVASGTAQEKIYFTSFLDDSIGGDTNGDSGATAPSSGDWIGINFYNPAEESRFAYSDFEYSWTNFYLDSGDLKIASSLISSVGTAIKSDEGNLKVENTKFDSFDEYGIETVGGSLILNGNSFTNGDTPVYADYETVLKNSGNSMSGNYYNGIGLYRNFYGVDLNKTFHKDVPYILFDSLNINENSTVTIKPGVVIKPDYGVGVGVYGGTLNIAGGDDDKIIMTSINDDSAYGDTDSGYGDSLPTESSWRGVYFGELSFVPKLENVAIRYSNGVYFDSVVVNLNKVDYENNRYIYFDSADAFLSKFYFENNGSFNIDGGNFEIYNSTIKNNDGGLYIDGSNVNINNSIIEDNQYIAVDQSSFNLINSSVLGSGNYYDSIMSWEAREINISGSVIKNSRNNGIYLDSASTTISGNYIFGNQRHGIYMATSAPATISGNDIYSNNDFGIYNRAYILSGGAPIDAKNNWWGDESGPYHELLNPEGIGDVVSDGVIFDPWLKASIEEPSGFSSVAFIPGIQASRLYRQGLLWENQLWEPNRNGDARKLFMDKDGKSVDSGIYTRDIIKETNVPVSADGFGLNIYKKFSESMDKLVASSTIAEWKSLPYDWRFDLSDIVGGGVKWLDGNISFINQKPEGQLPYMISELEELASNSKNGKVTIITHSNGGLVAKTLLKKLAEMKGRGESDLIDKIDRLIMVAAPQLGTPQAIISMLHGDGQELGFGWILSAPVAREFAENMLGAYNLLPSEKYVGMMADPIVKFHPSLDKINDWYGRYGYGLRNYGELRGFILGEGGRVKPDPSNVMEPNVLNQNLLAVSEGNHVILDNWQIPASVEVTQIAGWGLDTVSGIKYSANMECVPVTGVAYCVPDYVLEREPIITSDGDETVVTPSATALEEGNRYYLDLSKQNEAFSANIKHRNIFETQPLEDFIKNIIINSTTTPPSYITPEKPEPTSADNKLRLSIHSPVSIDIYDNFGNHTGIIPNPDPNSDLELVEENIPNSYYMNFGEGKYIGFDSGVQNRVELNGTGAGTFTLKVGEYSGDIEATSTAFIDIPVTSAMKGEINIQNLDVLPQLKIDVEGDGIFDFEVKPSQEFDPILFLDIMKKTIISFDLKKNVEKNLINRIDNLIKMIKKGKIKQAEKKIKSFIKKFEPKKKSDKKIGEEEKQAILNMLNQLLNNF